MHNASRLPAGCYCKYDLLRHIVTPEVAAIAILDLSSSQKVHSSFISWVICWQGQSGLIKMFFARGGDLNPKLTKWWTFQAAYIIRTFESAALEMQIFLDDQNVFEADNDVLWSSLNQMAPTHLCWPRTPRKSVSAEAMCWWDRRCVSPACLTRCPLPSSRGHLTDSQSHQASRTAGCSAFRLSRPMRAAGTSARPETPLPKARRSRGLSWPS